MDRHYLPHDAMQIVFDIGILVRHHLFVPIGIYFKERDVL